MRTAAAFASSETDIAALIAAHPLAQLVSVSPDGLIATPLPLLLDRDDDGSQYLLGILPRTTPLPPGRGRSYCIGRILGTWPPEGR